jgi:hypothetical protein
MRGEDALDDNLLQEMADKAIRYVRSFEWCLDIHEKYFGDGFGGIIALFLFRVSIRGAETPEWIWVFIGDSPSCYLEAGGYPSPRKALLRYVTGIEDWIGTREDEREARSDLPPIKVPPGPEILEILKGRMDTLRCHVLPHMKDA